MKENKDLHKELWGDQQHESDISKQHSAKIKYLDIV